MRVLLVAPLFPPDMGVSTLRMKSFYDSIASFHKVDVLKLGDRNELYGNVMQLDKRLITNFVYAIFNRSKIYLLLHKKLRDYDLIIVSATPYGIYEIANAAKRIGIPYILDLRDLPDLTTSEQRGKYPFLWLYTKEYCIYKYIRSISKHSVATLCVGHSATMIMQKKIGNNGCKFINVHNGFENEDIKYVNSMYEHYDYKDRNGIVIGWVGNIYRFRDTKELRHALKQLNTRREPIILKHWGKITDSLADYITSLKYIKYVQCVEIPRKKLLSELLFVDCLLLACSNDLAWEPTTTVFDYILFDKPVIFVGLRNNEAFSILQNTRIEIIEVDDLHEINLKNRNLQSKKNIESIINYSREYNTEKLLKIINKK